MEQRRHFAAEWETEDDAEAVSVGETTASGQNVTLEEREVNSTLLMVYNVLVIVQVVLLMLSMGSGVDISEIKRHITRPKGILVGSICQLLLMPLLTFAFAHATQLTPELAIGLVVISSCPGGAPSNFFTLLIRGDLSLSVCLTVVSSALSLATMPLNKFLYIRSWTSESAVIPYTSIITAVAATWIPAILGMLFRKRFPEQAPKLTKIGGLSAFLVLLAFAVVQQFVYPGVLALTWNVWFAALFLPIVGWVVGFGLATMFLFEIGERRSLAYGTSYVNGGIALALITITFETNKEANAYILFPMIYTACQLIVALVIALLHRLYFRMREKSTLCHRLCHKYRERSRPPHSLQQVIIGQSAPPLKLQQEQSEDKYTQYTEQAQVHSVVAGNLSQPHKNGSTVQQISPPPPYEHLTPTDPQLSVHI